MQYQQNFFPGSGSIGIGSLRNKPTTNMIPPVIEMGSPKIDTPRGAYRSVMMRNNPKTARIAPETTNPRYMSVLAE